MVRVLHVVTLSADGRELLLGASPDGRPSHSLALDERLARALRGEDPDGAAGPELQLSPRDIQARLRRGASIEEVAAEAGVGVARIERYAGPVESERAQVLSDARSAFLVRPRSGRSGHPLGEAVAANLGATAFARPETEAWSAVRAEDGSWTLTLRVVVRGRTRTARWRWLPARHELTALDAYGTQLGFVDAGVPLPPPAARPAPPVRARKAGRARGAGAAKQASVTKPPAKKNPPATKRAVKNAAVKKAAATKAAVKKAAATKVAPKKAAVKKPPAAKVAAKKAPVKRAAATKGPAQQAASAAARPARKAARRRTP